MTMEKEKTSAVEEQESVMHRSGRKKFAYTLSRIKNGNHFMDGNYNPLLKEVMVAKAAEKKTYEQEKRLKSFDYRIINGRPRLVANLPNDVREYLKLEEVYDYLVKCDIATDHGGYPALKRETDRAYANVTNAMIEMYISMCEMCHRKMKMRGLMSNKIMRLEVNSRGHITLIDKQSDPAGIYNYILLYQDEETKFTLLRPLVGPGAKEVATQLMDIFSIIGAPCVLNSNDVKAFLKKVIEELHLLCPDVKILMGKVVNNMAENVEIVSLKRVREYTATYLTDNPKSNWSNALRFVQFECNKLQYVRKHRTPYEAMFGVKLREGLITADLPPSVMGNIHCEEDFNKYLKDFSRGMEEDKNRHDSQSDDEQPEAKRPKLDE